MVLVENLVITELFGGTIEYPWWIHKESIDVSTTFIYPSVGAEYQGVANTKSSVLILSSVCGSEIFSFFRK